MTIITLQDVSFHKNRKEILSHINLVINDEEYVTLVGPTGAGKTTLVNLIAGLYKPTYGKIFFDDKDVTNLPPNERHCGVMFESYALFPHLNVLDNISYAQHMKQPNHDETYSLGRAIIDLVRLQGRDKALPKECSGGMQQRVALGRSLMALEESGILILDEPFKALDAGLRMNLRREVKKIAKSKELNLSTIHVTNDMQEAVMGDKVVVLDEGKIRQIGTPHEILYKPTDLFVTNFFSSELNFFSGKINRVHEIKKNNLDKDKLKSFNKEDLNNSKTKNSQNQSVYQIFIQSEEGYDLYAKTEKKFELGQDITFFIRSQYFKARHSHREDKTNHIFGHVKRVKFMGAWLRLEIETPYRIKKHNNASKYHNNNKKISSSEEIEHKISDEELKFSKLIKIEVPTTKTAIHNFTLGQEITIYFPSEYVIIFPRISNNELNEILQIH
ncbi:MAG: ABC transporter ATP-binding protein [Promethearchaeota archaeon]